MSEFAKGVRRRVVIAAACIAAGALASSYIESGKNQDPVKADRPAPQERKTSRPNHPKQEQGKPIKIAKIQGLEIGGKITDIPLIRPNRHMDGKFKYVPHSDGPSEDLVTVYSPRLNQLLRQKDIGSDRQKDKSIDMGFLLTSIPGGVLESLVAFDDKNQKVIDVYPGAPLPVEGFNPLYRNVYPPRQIGFTIEAEQIHSQNGEGVELSIDGLPPRPVGVSN